MALALSYTASDVYVASLDAGISTSEVYNIDAIATVITYALNCQ
jgi:hypothetical protein